MNTVDKMRIPGCRHRRSVFPLLGGLLCIVMVLGGTIPGRAGAEEGRAGAAGDIPVVSPENIPGLIDTYEQYLQSWRKAHSDQLNEQGDSYALAELKLVKARLLRENYWAGEERDQQVQECLKDARQLILALREGEPPNLKKHGQLERAYLAANDGSAQPYQLYVPESYDGTESYGVLVYLHGYSPDLNRENWGRYMYPDVLDKYARRTDSIVLMPFARSNTDFQGCGEDDVMRAIEEVEDDYNIDPDRVILSGYSMGGMGVWTIGAHYPQRFAALLAMSSRADFYYWKDIEPGDIPPFKQKMAEQEFGINLLPNYAHLPIYMIHGTEDFGIPVEQSRRMKAKLKDMGRDLRYVELEGKGHSFFYRQLEPMTRLARWLRSQKRETSPRRVTFRTYTLSYPRAYWVKIRAIENWAKAAEIECVVEEGGKQITLTTNNVCSLVIDPPDEYISNVRNVTVVWNGEAATARRRGGKLVLERGEKERKKKELYKTPELCGPVREVFSGPFVMVYGAEKGGSQALAHQTATDWERFAKGEPTMLGADEVDKKTIKNNNLILFGTPSSNRLVGEVVDDLPVRFTSGTVQLAGHSYDLDEHGLWLIYPNPLNQERYVVLNAGVPWGKELPENHKYDMIPDFMVYTGEKTADGTECNKYRAAGFFNQYWELSPESTWFSDHPK